MMKKPEHHAECENVRLPQDGEVAELRKLNLEAHAAGSPPDEAQSASDYEGADEDEESRQQR